MDAVLATILVVAFWGLLWLGATWAGQDSRDGGDRSNRGSVTGRPPRTFDETGAGSMART
jgi:hypothetical protein